MSKIAEAFYAKHGHYPDTPGWKEPTTSRAAAPTREAAKTLRDQVYAEIIARPSTADEVAAAINRSVLSVRPRLSELRKMNKIGPSGLPDRPNESGKDATVWHATRGPHGHHNNP